MSELVPDGWKVDFFPCFAEINPRLDASMELAENTKVSFLKMEDVSNSATVTNKRVRTYGEVKKGFTKFQDDDILVAKITPCFENGKGGHVENLTNGVGFGSTEFHVFRAKSNSDSRYLYQFVNDAEFRLKAEASMCGTGGQRRVQTDFFRTYKATFPPLPEQQKIATILTSVDSVIEKTEAQINKLQDLKKGMMQELLSPQEGSKQAKAFGHTEFKDSPVGRIPKGWEVCSAIDVSEEIMVGVVIKPTQYYVESGIPALRSANVREEGLTMKNLKYFSPESNEKLKKSKLRLGDLLTVRTGYPGTTAVVTEEFVGSNCIDVVITRPSRKMNSHYFSMWINSDFGKGQVLKAQGGLAQQHFNVGDMKSLLVVVPTLEEQDSIFRRVEALTKKIKLLTMKLHSYKSLKKALMQDLLTGKVRVKTD